MDVRTQPSYTGWYQSGISILLRYEGKDRFHRLAIEGLIELSSLSVVFTTIYIHEYSYTFCIHHIPALYAFHHNIGFRRFMLLYFHPNIGSMRFMLIMPTSCPNISGVIGRVYSLHILPTA